MDFNRFTEKLQEGFRSAQSLAASRGNQQIDVEHLLLALLEQADDLAALACDDADDLSVGAQVLRGGILSEHRIWQIST